MNNLYVRAIRSALVGFLCFFAVIFIPAWTSAYWQGWVFFLTISISTTLATVYIALHDKELLESRLRALLSGIFAVGGVHWKAKHDCGFGGRKAGGLGGGVLAWQRLKRPNRPSLRWVRSNVVLFLKLLAAV